MSKVKKVLAIILSMAMILGMSLTTFAATPVLDITSKITVAGLSEGVATDIDMYRFATLQYDEETNEYSWDIEEWASRYVILNGNGTAYTIPEDAETRAALKKAAVDSGAPTISCDDEMNTSHEFKDVPIGGYIIIPSDERADYLPLFVTNNYNREDSPLEGEPVAKDVVAYAKSENHTITKEQGDDFAQIGQKVNYTIHATFPMSKNSVGDILNNFVITDTPAGLAIDESTVKVTLGETDNDITTQIDVDVNSGVLTVDFANILAGGHDGKDIVITYTATVTDTEYNNNASANSNTTTYKSGETNGDTGSITLTKVDAENHQIKLSGAEFEVYDLGVDGEWNPQNPGTSMQFVYDEELQAYRPALSTDSGSSATVKVSDDENATLIIVGLDEGNYHFKETKAPSGYSINEDGLTVTIVKDTAEDKVVEFTDTKLASLPETGGIGTTIFTIGGCTIMIAAAGLYFASRRKQENK